MVTSFRLPISWFSNIYGIGDRVREGWDGRGIGGGEELLLELPEAIISIKGLLTLLNRRKNVHTPK